MLVLGSKSPRRKEILNMVGVDFKVVVPDVLENVEEKDPKQYVMKTAEKKGQACMNIMPDDVVLTCDTVVSLDNKILEKPKSKEEAYKMIKAISGKNHLVYTGVFIGNKKEKYKDLFCVETKVIVDELTEEEINNYVNTSEPYDKAGGYAIQGYFGKYIKGIEGDYFNVVGLPINEVCIHLKKYYNNF